MQHFVFYKRENFLAYTRTRPGETKLGEKLQAINNEKRWADELKKSSAAFVLIGIPESIGVKANLGTGGTETAWNAFLASFFNIQHNEFLDAEKILLLGYFDFSGWQENTNDKPVEILRETVAKIDKVVTDIIQRIVAAGKIPIVIGGGHNNAYGNIKGAALGLHHLGKIKTSKINVINLDAHADLRALEGRHSGNGFSYAIQDGFLGKYSVIGLHENYMTQPMLDQARKNKNIQTCFYEDIAVRQNITFGEAVQQGIEFTKNTYTGIELDLDAIENILTSAATPSGFSALQARQFIHQAALQEKIAYLHISEGTAKSDNGSSSATIGKLISYLVSDFVKS